MILLPYFTSTVDSNNSDFINFFAGSNELNILADVLLSTSTPNPNPNAIQVTTNNHLQLKL